MGEIGRWLVIAGIAIAAVGLILVAAGRIPGVGHLPGDIAWRRGNFTFFAPIGTMIVVSIVLTIIVNIVMRLFK